MDKELAQLLEWNKLGELQATFLEHKVYSVKALKMLTDQQFEKMGVAIGHVGSLRAVLADGSSKAEEGVPKQKEGKITNEERIRRTIQQIRETEKGKRKETMLKSKATKGSYRTKKSNKSSQEEVEVKVGWLHRNSASESYKQVRIQDGGSVRKLLYKGDEIHCIDTDSIVKRATRLFFPGGKSKFGALNDMNISLGNYSRESMTTFTTLDGEQCTYLQYLRDQGLYASKVTFYLLSTKKVNAEEQSSSDDPVAGTQPNEEAHATLAGLLTSADDFSTTDSNANAIICSREVLNGEISELEISEEIKLTVLSTKGDREVSRGVSRAKILSIEYAELRESSYCEVIIRCVSNSMKQCYEHQMFSEPLIQEIQFNEYCPLEHGPYTVKKIAKGDKCFLDCVVQPSQDDPDQDEMRYIFPEANIGEQNKLILHPPSDVWGYDGNRLVAGVVTSCHMQPNVRYIWYRDGEIIKEGNNLCCIPIDEMGTYSVEVQYGEAKEVAAPFTVIGITPREVTPSTESAISKPNIPVVDKEEISFSPKDEIGRGQFGIVYRGTWAGTTVAVKHIKVRNAKRLSSTIENEVAVHSWVRHPNIVQIMGVSFLKNSIYIISEFIEGRNLDEIVFGEGDESFTIHTCDKMSICKQLCQAVAYMHNLKPQVLHRDIKPANVLVANGTHVTKLCDMGLSRLKSSQSLTQTAMTIPGTPHYMAPECLLHKRSATASSDVWSLACTLVELFTGADFWVAELDKQPGDQVTALMAIMSKGEPPRCLDDLQATDINELHTVLVRCFNYTEVNRPSAIDILTAVTHAV